MLVLYGAVLNATECVVELLGNRTWLAILGEDIALACLQVVNLRDGRNHGSRAAGSSLLEGFQFFLWECLGAIVVKRGWPHPRTLLGRAMQNQS